jgi:tetratricopeptide (TPR) repeat protein
MNAYFGRIVGMALAAAFLAVALPAPAEEVAAPPPWAEDYIARQETVRYFSDVDDYLRLQPESPYASMIAFEAMMLASEEGRPHFVDGMQRRLLFEYPNSFQTAYLLSSFDAKTYAKLYAEGLDVSVAADAVASEQRLEAISAALKRWGPKVFADADVSLKVGLLAQRHQSYRLATLCEDSWKSQKGDAAKVAAILLDRQASSVDKVRSLAKLDKSDKQARIAREFLFVGLRPEERAEADALKIVLKDLVYDKQWELSNSIIDELLALNPDDSQAKYWRTWILLGMERPEDAMAAAKTLQESSPDDPWATAAGVLVDSFAQREATIDSFVLLKDFCEARIEEIQGLESNLHFEWESRTIHCYTAIRTKPQHLELVVKCDDKIVIAFRADEQEVAYHIGGTSAVHVAAVPIEAPIPIVKVDRSLSEKKWQFRFDAKISDIKQDNYAKLRGTMNELRKLVADRQALTWFYDDRARDGRVFVPVTINAEGIQARCLSMSIDEPSAVWESVDVAVLPGEFRLSAIEMEQGSLDLRLATGSNFVYSNPSWPDLPIIRTEEFEFATFFRDAAESIGSLQRAGFAHVPDVGLESKGTKLEMKTE